MTVFSKILLGLFCWATYFLPIFSFEIAFRVLKANVSDDYGIYRDGILSFSALAVVLTLLCLLSSPKLFHKSLYNIWIVLLYILFYFFACTAIAWDYRIVFGTTWLWSELFLELIKPEWYFYVFGALGVISNYLLLSAITVKTNAETVCNNQNSTMKSTFFKSNKKKSTPNNDEVVDERGFTQRELEVYDKNVDYYYTNLINALILFTYNEKELDQMAPILIDPLTELYEELDYAFIPILFDTIFKNNLIPNQFKSALLEFRTKVDDIPDEIWDWEFLDTHDTWLSIKKEANQLLDHLGIKSRTYNTDYTYILSNDGTVMFKGKKIKNR